MSRRIASIAVGIVVVGREVAADELEDRLHLLADRREDELVAPDGVPAELALVGLDPLGDEAPAALGRRAAPRRSRRRRRTRRRRAARRRRGPRSSSATAPRSSPSCDPRPSSGAARGAARRPLPRVFSMTARRLSVADSWAKLSIQWIFQWRSWMSIASSSRQAASARFMSVGGVEARLEDTRSCVPSPGRSRSRHQSAKSRP